VQQLPAARYAVCYTALNLNTFDRISWWTGNIAVSAIKSRSMAKTILDTITIFNYKTSIVTSLNKHTVGAIKKHLKNNIFECIVS